MIQRIYHGLIDPLDLANSLVSHFHRGNYRVQRLGDANKLVVQIATHDRPMSGGHTAVSVVMQRVGDGVSVQVGEQAFLGVAASLGVSAISVLRNPLSLLNRLDDIAQDIESLQLSDEVWRCLDNTARTLGATLERSERLKRISCAYCDTANAVGEPRCIACGAPLGSAQPRACRKCGYVVYQNEGMCPNCKSRM